MYRGILDGQASAGRFLELLAASRSAAVQVRGTALGGGAALVCLCRLISAPSSCWPRRARRRAAAVRACRSDRAVALRVGRAFVAPVRALLPGAAGRLAARGRAGGWAPRARARARCRVCPRRQLPLVLESRAAGARLLAWSFALRPPAHPVSPSPPLHPSPPTLPRRPRSAARKLSACCAGGAGGRAHASAHRPSPHCDGRRLRSAARKSSACCARRWRPRPRRAPAAPRCPRCRCARRPRARARAWRARLAGAACAAGAKERCAGPRPRSPLNPLCDPPPCRPFAAPTPQTSASWCGATAWRRCSACWRRVSSILGPCLACRVPPAAAAAAAAQRAGRGCAAGLLVDAASRLLFMPAACRRYGSWLGRRRVPEAAAWGARRCSRCSCTPC